MKNTIHTLFVLKSEPVYTYRNRWNNSNILYVQNCQFVLFDTVIN